MLKLRSLRLFVRASSTVATVETIPDFPMGSRIFSFIQPTGKIHIGNYLGAVRNWKQIIDKSPKGVDCVFGTADLHSLTQIPTASDLSENRYGAMASLISSGIDPEKCILFHQSSVPEHSELYWILTCLTSMGALNRMTQWKLKASIDESLSIYSELVMGSTKAGILLYPVLQAADIMLYNSTHVPVGDDQSQHLELCRGIASTFNHTYGEFFNIPTTILTPTKKILSLRNTSKKMSKSDKDQTSSVYMTDNEDTIAKKFRKAVTDSVQGQVTFDPENRPGVSNLINIIAGVQNKTIDEAVESLSWISNHKQLKDHVTELVIEEFRDKKKTYDLLMEDRAHLDAISTRGTEKAREIATRNLEQIKKRVGLA